MKTTLSFSLNLEPSTSLVPKPQASELGCASGRQLRAAPFAEVAGTCAHLPLTQNHFFSPPPAHKARKFGNHCSTLVVPNLYSSVDRQWWWVAAAAAKRRGWFMDAT